MAAHTSIASMIDKERKWTIYVRSFSVTLLGLVIVWHLVFESLVRESISQTNLCAWFF
jgi:hypothetical protein